MDRIFYYFVKPITCVNDSAQRNIFMLQDFINDFKRQMMSGKAFSKWSGLINRDKLSYDRLFKKCDYPLKSVILYQNCIYV